MQVGARRKQVSRACWCEELSLRTGSHLIREKQAGRTGCCQSEVGRQGSLREREAGRQGWLA
jgi:hypothetical protein